MQNESSLLPDPHLQGLPRGAARRLAAAAQALRLGQVADAEQSLDSLISMYPDHAEVLRMYAGLRSVRGDHQSALSIMERAIALRPDDAAYWSSLGSALIEASRYDDAIAALQRACELDPDYTSASYNLGLALIRCMRVDEAVTALRRAVSHPSQDTVNARVILGDILRGEGRLDDAIGEYRAALKQQPFAGQAWWALAEIKTQRFADDDLAKLQEAMEHPGASEDDRYAMGFALAKAFDDRARYAEVLAALAQAHSRARARRSWNASAYTAYIDAILDTFTPPPAGARAGLGHEAIFIVSMPRSGSTLTEQVLASHSLVASGNEVSDLPAVLMDESKRLNKPFPQFAADLSQGDWERMGHRYMERVARWRGDRPRCTDKLAGNWHFVGAIRAMLPGARIIVARRDPLETCLACYRQQLVEHDYTHTYNDLAATWREFDRVVRRWRLLHPTHVYENIYEEFTADPEVRIRALLEFCDLPFEAGCLEFHKSERKVLTPSATQVREPLRRDTARAQRYGALLNPLRAELGLPPYSDDSSKRI